jgi:crotonobetainyl-CoA:carnitine CoA-transferase CaiB-like acyl-CoA transferase
MKLPADGLLRGLRVLEVAPFLPGPFCAQVLSDLGADVIKIEPPGGDPARELEDGIYTAANRNKRAVQLDLKSADGTRKVLELAKDADVLIEGFRAGVMDRLGLGHAAVAATNQAVVYCSISGYGQTGPKRQSAGHDLTFLADAGGLWFSPHVGEAPRRSGIPVADLAASSYAAISILAALRRRDLTGQGCHLDVAIADALLAFASPRAGADFARSDAPAGIAYATNEVYEAADGRHLAVAAVEEKFWRTLQLVLSPFDARINDPAFGTASGRRRHAGELKAVLAEILVQQDAAAWLDLFARADVPAALVRSPLEAAADEHAVARGIVQRSPGGSRYVAFPVLMDGSVLGTVRSDPPALGGTTADLSWRV